MSEAPKPTPTRGVEITLDKKRYLRYPLGVLNSMKDGKTTLGQLLFLGLKRDDPELTLEQVEDMIDLENLKDLFEPVKKATGGIVNLTRVFGDMVEDEQDPQ